MVPDDSDNIFDLAPMSLWLEDYTTLREQFEAWRAEGVTDLRAFLLADPARLAHCSSLIHVLKVNRKTLSLYEADSVDHLVANLGRVLRDDMLEAHIDELKQLWDGATEFRSNTVNYTLGGKRLDIQLRGIILPGHEQVWDRVLLAIEDVTALEDARRQTAKQQQYASALFEHSPVSLWVEDFSRIKQLMDDLRARGIVDFRVFTDVHPEFVRQCMSEIRVLDINKETLALFLAADKPTLLQNLPRVFQSDMEAHFREQLIDLWNGVFFQRREVLNHALDGTERYLLLQLSLLPGHEEDWSQVQVALTDITARKKAEAYLEYLGKHDVLTKLFNRAFYVDELNRLERNNFSPVSIIAIDLDRLKSVNDQWGHATGDALLRRVGEILNEAVKKPGHAARIGGDEFAVVLPYVDERGATAMMENIARLVEINNQYYSQMALSVSMGAATSQDGEKLESVARRADLLMYENKHRHHSDPS
ncbi:GGDEF domain-containing protein [Labrys neptuniae]|uniref:sensor domain-containing diguanylate cyclase n=1 Tax=Labrys neptuniae TaxID=376174 RepID=UPI00288DDC15|nr:GGDEF domain-containing protein [Labrys neptuniae]MDT3382131.1 GGDEF domain-containing protein [Labrys neptuniae]